MATLTTRNGWELRQNYVDRSTGALRNQHDLASAKSKSLKLYHDRNTDESAEILRVVTFREIGNGEIETFQIVRGIGDGEISFSEKSPFGIAFLGKPVGAIVDVNAPGGNFRFEILAINAANRAT